jgi:hypothetical protein
MGVLRTLKRWMNARDSYYTIARVNAIRPFLRDGQVNRVTASSHAALDYVSGEPEEHLQDAQFSCETPDDQLALRNADITRERLRRLRSK